ncbi:unnamed protein product [Rangifer tarandus platyrhynchus]|uniref:Uncharacterized protein n=1 Tax=Rangifer tarandus platyrhynchus TaxID=3082113 RepID=A0ACB1KHL1_RANTA
MLVAEEPKTVGLSGGSPGEDQGCREDGIAHPAKAGATDWGGRLPRRLAPAHKGPAPPGSLAPNTVAAAQVRSQPQLQPEYCYCIRGDLQSRCKAPLTAEAGHIPSLMAFKYPDLGVSGSFTESRAGGTVQQKKPKKTYDFCSVIPLVFRTLVCTPEPVSFVQRVIHSLLAAPGWGRVG